MRHLIPLVVCFGLFACEKNDSAPLPTEPVGAELAAAAEPTPEPEIEEAAYITGTTSLKKIPSDDKRIDDPEGKAKKKISNWRETLYRGEEVTLLGKENNWAHVRTSADVEGWLNPKNLLRAADVTMATVFDEVKIFRRPDLLALSSGKKITAGNLLFVLKSKEQFAQVNYPSSEYSGANAWVLSEKLSKDDAEIAVAKLIMKIRTLRKKKDPSATELTDLARSQYKDSKLLSLLDEEGAEGEAADKDKDAAADSSGTDTAETTGDEKADGEAQPATTSTD